ncbi:hypothetical protein [Streptomyces sp. NPDC001970]
MRLSTYDNVKAVGLYVHKTDLNALRRTTRRCTYDAQIGTLEILETLADWSVDGPKSQDRNPAEPMTAPPVAS